jgi:O-acetyl-ADP-ribose deacetylase (regulator of RNase III)
MPFEIVGNDIVNMQVDAIVNTANPKPIIGYGCDAGIHKKAGPRLLEARKAIGDIYVGHAAITPGFDLDARYVIHAVGPLWRDGDHGEAELLRRCYDSALSLAAEYKCESVASPLLSAGNHGFPKPVALQTAISAISAFLMDHEMHIYLVVFGRQTFGLSEKLVGSVQSFIDENYIREKTLDEYGVADKCDVRQMEHYQIRNALELQRRRRYARMLEEAYEPEECAPCPAPQSAALPDLLRDLDAGFSETLTRTLEGEYEIRFYIMDLLGKLEGILWKQGN